jgi:hypothetical protein
MKLLKFKKWCPDMKLAGPVAESPDAKLEGRLGGFRKNLAIRGTSQWVNKNPEGNLKIYWGEKHPKRETQRPRGIPERSET